MVCRCWTYIVLVQKHPLTHQCLPPSSLKGGQRVLDAQSVLVLKHLLAASPTWSVRPAGPAWAYVLVLCKHPLKFSCGRASTSSRQARSSQCYNENPRGSGPKFKDENLAALQMNMLVTRPFVVLGPADWCAPIFGSNLTDLFLPNSCLPFEKEEILMHCYKHSWDVIMILSKNSCLLGIN